MRNEAVFKWYIYTLIVLGICPFEGVYYRKKSRFSKIYVFFILFTITSCVIVTEVKKLSRDRLKYTLIEFMLKSMEFLVTVGIFLTISYSNIMKPGRWKKFFKQYEDFCQMCNFASDQENIEKTYKITTPEIKKNMIPQEWNIKTGPFAIYSDVTKNTEDKKRLVHIQKHTCGIIKLVLVHIFVPCLSVVDNLTWSENYGFSLKGALYHFPQHIVLYYELIASMFLWTISSILQIKYRHLKNTIRLTFLNTQNQSFNDIKVAVRDIKFIYKRLHQMVEILSNIFGMTILLIFFNLVIRFLMNLTWWLFMSKELAFVMGTCLYEFTFLVSIIQEIR